MRTIDADELRETIENHVTTVSCCPTVDWSRGKTQFKKQCLEDIDAATTIGGWISVKDRLPEVGQKVLTYSKYGHVSDRTLERHGGQNGYDVLLFSPDGMKPGTDITHWMPMPGSPKEI